MAQLQPHPMTIRLAILGAGIFAREAHFPALRALGNRFEIVAIFSRTEASAQALAVLLPKPVKIYTDPELLLADDSIDAVDIVLPIAVQPPLIEAALRAGKHVISEKPMAPDVATGKRLLQVAAESRSVWMVAENLRYEAGFIEAARIVRGGELGRVYQFSWAVYNSLTPQNKYYQTTWRRDNSFPGGFIMDGGIHNAAAIRMIMGEVVSVKGFAVQNREDLPPVDTLSAALKFECGALGIFNIGVAGASNRPNTIQVVGERGLLSLTWRKLEVTIDGQTRSQEFEGNNIEAELADFANAVEHGKPGIATPEETLRDVALLEALLDAGRTEGSVAPQRIP